MIAHSNETMAFSADGRHLFTSGGQNNLAKMWEVETGELVHRFLGHHRKITGLRLSPDGRRLITYSMDATLRIWDIDSGKELLVLTDPSFEGAYLWVVSMSPDGQTLFAGSKQSKQLVTWSAASPGQIDTWLADRAADAEKWASLEEAVAKGRADRRGQGYADRAAARAAEENGPPAEPLAIKSWLVLAPIPIGNDDLDAAVGVEHVAGEAGFRPRGNQHVTIDGVEHTWKSVTPESSFLDLDAVLGAETRNSVAYAVSYIDCDEAHENVKLYLDFEPRAKLYFNGKEVFPAGAGDSSPVVNLESGSNVVVLKLLTGEHASSWQGRVWLGDADRRKPSLQGVRPTLDPGF